MNILVTGGAGFIGSSVVDAYLEQGHNVIVVDNLFTGKEKNLNENIVFYNLDICDLSLGKIFKKHNIDIVNHHAAQLDVRKSVENPIFDAQVNIIGSLNLLENSMKYKVKKFIFASSGGVMYGESGEVSPDENIPGKPMSPYGVSKLTVENYLRYYSALYGLKYTVLRYGNVYGPRQDPFGEAGVVAIFSRAMIRDEGVFIYGDGEQLRDYVFVGDVVSASLLSLYKGEGEIINIGTGKTESVNSLFKAMSRITLYRKEPVYKAQRPGELLKSSLNVDKAKRLLSWVAEKQFSKGLEETVRYFRGELHEG